MYANITLFAAICPTCSKCHIPFHQGAGHIASRSHICQLSFAMHVGSAIILYGSIAFAQQSQNATSKALEFSSTNITSLLKPGNTTYNTVLLDAKMLQLTASNKPQDIATLAFILGYPLVPVAGDYAYYTTRACYCSVTSNSITNGSTINLRASSGNAGPTVSITGSTTGGEPDLFR